MALINRRTRQKPISFYKGSTYEPHNIGNWVATDSRELPWITIGKALESTRGKGKTVDHVMTAVEVLDRTGLDIDVQKFPLQDADSGKVLPRLFATGYDDPDTDERFYFGAVTDKYEVVPPRDLLSMFDSVVASIDGAGYSAAWNMREKSMMGVTIDLPTEISVDPKGADDRIGLHLLGINSMDGSTGVTGTLTSTRWWCMNQCSPTLGGAKRSFSLRHTKNVQSRMFAAAESIGLIMDYANSLDAVANKLYQRKMTDRQFETFLAKIPQFQLAADVSDVVRDRVDARRLEAQAAWRAPHNANIAGTRWGALNVVAEFIEWGRNVKGSARTGTDPIRQRAIGTMVHPTVTGTVNLAMELLAG